MSVIKYGTGFLTFMRGRLSATTARRAPCPVGAVVRLMRLQRTQRTEANSAWVAHEHWHWRTHTSRSHTDTSAWHDGVLSL